MADDGKRIMHAHLKLNGGSLMLNDDFPEFGHGAATAPASVTLHLQVPDADAAWQRALDAGSEVRFPLADQFWGDRYGQVKTRSASPGRSARRSSRRSRRAPVSRRKPPPKRYSSAA